MTSPFISSGLVLMLRVDWIYPAVWAGCGGHHPTKPQSFGQGF